MSNALHRALTSAADALERSAKLHRMSTSGRAKAVRDEADAKLIRDNLDALSALQMTPRPMPPGVLSFSPCNCSALHCRGEPNFGQFCKKARAE